MRHSIHQFYTQRVYPLTQIQHLASISVERFEEDVAVSGSIQEYIHTQRRKNPGNTESLGGLEIQVPPPEEPHFPRSGHWNVCRPRIERKEAQFSSLHEKCSEVSQDRNRTQL